MAVAIKAGQWGRNKLWGWSTGVAVEIANTRWFSLTFNNTNQVRIYTTFRSTGRYVDEEEDHEHDIIEVSDTDPRAVQADAVQEPEAAPAPTSALSVDVGSFEITSGEARAIVTKTCFSVNVRGEIVRWPMSLLEDLAAVVGKSLQLAEEEKWV